MQREFGDRKISQRTERMRFRQSKILSPMQNCFEITFRFKTEYLFRISIFELWIEKSIQEKHLVKSEWHENQNSTTKNR